MVCPKTIRKYSFKWEVILKKQTLGVLEVGSNVLKRYKIAGGKIVGESAAEDTNVVNDWLTNVWHNIQEHYEYKDIFNADKTGLFYKMDPVKILKLVGETCGGGKLSKVRIRVLVTVNKSGTEK